MSGAPDFIDDPKQDDGETGPNEQDNFLTSLSGGAGVIRDLGIGVEKLMSLAKNQESGGDENAGGDGKCNTQCRNSGALDHADQRRQVVDLYIHLTTKDYRVGLAMATPRA